jgi:ATP-dependent Clp protease protease subunit
MQTHNNYSFGLNKKKPTKQPKREIHEDISEEDPFEQLTNMFKPQSSMDRDKNHIYFYQSVDQQSCLELNRKINDLNKDLMQHAIEYEREPPNIYLHINSFGGSLFAAFATIDTIINSKIPIVSIIEGCAASAATIISMVCHKRYCTQNSFMLIHQLSTGASGNIQDIRRSIAEGEKYNTKLFTLLGQYCDKKPEQVLEDASRDLWLDAEEAKAYGIIDDIITTKKK